MPQGFQPLIILQPFLLGTTNSTQTIKGSEKMGMPCEVNSILKLKPSQGYPEDFSIKTQHQASKEGYRIIPVDVPIPLVDENWVAHADIVINKLTWENYQTVVLFAIHRIYDEPFFVKFSR